MADMSRYASSSFIKVDDLAEGPEELAIVTVGNPKEFGKPLTTLGKVNDLDLTIPEPKQELSKADAGMVFWRRHSRRVHDSTSRRSGRGDAST